METMLDVGRKKNILILKILTQAALMIIKKTTVCILVRFS